MVRQEIDAFVQQLNKRCARCGSMMTYYEVAKVDCGPHDVVTDTLGLCCTQCDKVPSVELMRRRTPQDHAACIDALIEALLLSSKIRTSMKKSDPQHQTVAEIRSLEDTIPF